MNNCILILITSLIFNINGICQNEPLAIEVAPSLYEVPLMGCNASFYISDSGVVAIDAGMTYEDGLQLVEAIHSVTSKPITSLILTHYHFDHIGGILAFPTTTKIIAHSNFLKNCKQDNGKLRNDFIQELEADFIGYQSRKNEVIQELIDGGYKEKADSVKANIKSYHDFINSVKIAPPVKVDRTFTQLLDLKLGTKNIILKNYGGGHTGSDVVVYFPNANAAHVGDLCIGQSIPLVDGPSGGSITNWIKTLGEISKEESIKTIVTGHNKIEVKQGLLDMQQLLTELKEETIQAINTGLSEDAAVNFVKMDKYAKYPSRDLLEKDVRAVYKEMKKN